MPSGEASLKPMVAAAIRGLRRKSARKVLILLGGWRHKRASVDAICMIEFLALSWILAFEWSTVVRARNKRNHEEGRLLRTVMYFDSWVGEMGRLT